MKRKKHGLVFPTSTEIKPVREPGTEGRREAANLPGACWELNLAGETSALSEKG